MATIYDSITVSAMPPAGPGIMYLGYVDGNIQVMTCTENVTKENDERRQRFVDEKIRGRAVEESSEDPF